MSENVAESMDDVKKQPNDLELSEIPKSYLMVRDMSFKEKLLLKLKRKKPKYYAYFINMGKVYRTGVYDTKNNWFKFNDYYYYINTNKAVKSDTDDKPVLFYKLGISEPINPKPNPNLIEVSSELTNSFENNIIKDFKKSGYNKDSLLKFIYVLVGVAVGSLIVSILNYITISGG